MINPFQTGLVPVGHFDFLDSQISTVVGGEVAVLSSIPTLSLDTFAPDVYSSTTRTVARLATRSDNGPFYLLDTNRSSLGEGEIGFETTTLFSTAGTFARPENTSGKLSLWAQEGFYSISTNAVDTATLNTSTSIYTKLFVNSLGQLTASESLTRQIVGYFIEFRSKSVIDAQLNRFQYAGTSRLTDTIIIYKTNADGYSTTDIINNIISSSGTIGAPTDGTYSDGYFSFTSNTKISDAVDNLNEALGAISSGAATTALGTPADGTYSDGFFPFIPSTTVANAVDDINELLFAIAPAPPGNLTGTILSVSGTTLFSAILPSGLSAAWFTGGDSPGDTITSYIVDGTYLLDSASQASIFNGGVLSNPSQLGIVTHVLNGADGSAHDATTGVGTTGTVTVDDISTYNTIWNKINAEIAVVQTAEGRQTHAMKHTLSGTSNISEFFLDTINASPSFSVAPVATENTPIDGYLSGIIHYASGSTFDLDYTAASGIFNRAYHPTEVSRIEIPGAPNTAVNPGVIPAFADTFIVSAQTITLSTTNVARESPSATVRLFKPNGDTTSAADTLGRAINTFGTASTTTTESFVDEARRLLGIGSSSPDWTSSDVLVDGNAQVRIVGSGGQVQFADATDYPGFVAAEQIYQRHFTKASASSGTIVFGGFTVAQIDTYGTGDTNVLLRLDTDDLYFDCGRAFGSNNGNGSGDSPVNSIGCQVGTSSGNNLDFTLGVNSTATNGNQYRVQLIFRNTADSITSLTTS